MIYDVRQSTIYHYAAPVAVSHHILRLMPVDRPHQRVHAASLNIAPHPVRRREGRDYFGNRMTWVSFDQPHETLTVRVAARIAVEHGAPPEAAATMPWNEVRAAAFTGDDLSPASPVHHLFPSRQVSLDPEIRAYAALSFAAGRPVLEGAFDLTQRIKREFAYDTAATTVTTTAPMSFALRRGVCQDFSHIMISGLRGLGLPAAYVSGYLRTVPSPDAVRLQGADAMHAWVLLWCGPGTGWIGLDPTNGMLAGDDHVVLAIGRDYADVAPIDGVIVAAGGQQIEVAVQVIPLK